MGKGWIRSVLVLLLSALFMLALAACGSSGVQSTFSDGGEAGGGMRDAKARDVTDLTHDTGVLHGGNDGAMGAGMLSITPKNPVLAITSTSMPGQMFKAELAEGGTSQAITANWSLSSFAIGDLS